MSRKKNECNVTPVGLRWIAAWFTYSKLCVLFAVDLRGACFKSAAAVAAAHRSFLGIMRMLGIYRMNTEVVVIISQQKGDDKSRINFVPPFTPITL